MTDSGQSWYILRHPNPTMIEDIFTHKKTVSLTDEELESPRLAFEYFIPFCEMHFKPSMAKDNDAGKDWKYDPKSDGNALRADLHSFVFVYGTEHLVSELLNRSWNKGLKVPIQAMKRPSGGRIKVSQPQLNLFRNAIRQMDFQVCEGTSVGDEVKQGDRVMVIEGPMKGGQGVITEIRESKGRVRLTIAFDMFGNMMKIAVPGFEVANVRLHNEKVGQMLKDPVIANFENELIELLCHRHGERGSRELNKSDRKQLDFLYKYAGIEFEADDDKAKFEALMLICVYLMNEKELVKERIQTVEHLLQGAREPHNDLECYLMTALFITTHDVELRQKVKAYRQSHPDCPLSIRRFLSIAKKIKI